MHINKKAFTLIELLVVVLIIGILAAIAWPKYQVAIMRTKIASTLPLLKAVAQAEYRHKLVTGYYTTNYAALDITIHGDCLANKCQVGNNLLQISTASGQLYLYFDTSRDTPNYAKFSNSINYVFERNEPENYDGVKPIPGDLICINKSVSPPSPNTVFSKACQTFSPIASEILNNGYFWLIRGI